MAPAAISYPAISLMGGVLVEVRPDRVTDPTKKWMAEIVQPLVNVIGSSTLGSADRADTQIYCRHGVTFPDV